MYLDSSVTLETVLLNRLRVAASGVEYLLTEIKLAERLDAARQEAGILLTDRRPDAYRL
jgi:hypothetical protein